MISPNKKNSLKLAAIDLFCGVGGMTHGLVKEGIRVVAGIDIDPSCRYSFEKNNAAKFIEADAKELNTKDIADLYPKDHVKVLVGCAPCQPFSGYRGKVPRGDKWSLLYSFANAIRNIKPDIVSMENVPGLLRFKRPRVFEEFCESLRTLGYHVSHQNVFCPDYGIPQTRTRLVLLASKFGPIKLIARTHAEHEYKTVRDTIERLSKIKDGETSPSDPLHRASKLSDTNIRRIKATPAAGSWKDWNRKLLLKCHKKETGRSYGSVYGRMRWDSPAPTMTTLCIGIGNGRFGHPAQDRAISLREAALFQTFPKSYDFINPKGNFSAKAIARHIGNAVPVRLGRIIARSIKKHIAEHHD